MNLTGTNAGRYVLYGAPVSLYTGKVRSYLRKQGIDFVEVSPGSERYINDVVPTVGRWIIPVIETPDGRFIQDGADIIDHFEKGDAATKYPAYPTSPLHRAVSHVFEIFGGEGLLRPAMHYRWSFDEQNLTFLESEFTSDLFPPMPEENRAPFFAHSSGRMRKAAVGFGVAEETAGIIEDSFHEWLSVFSAHLVHNPYLLGSQPTLGDYGLMAAMWAHLYRDPAPAMVVKQRAPRVGRWVERMCTSEPYESEYLGDDASTKFAGDSVPETLLNMMRYVAEEYLPEISAHIDFANNWITERPDLETGTNGLKFPGARGIGTAEFAWRGTTIRTAVMPYRFWLLQRLQDAFETADEAGQAVVRSTFRQVGLEPLLDLRTIRRVERTNHLEVWGPLIS
jgi:glutathione S-transferase